MTVFQPPPSAAIMTAQTGSDPAAFGLVSDFRFVKDRVEPSCQDTALPERTGDDHRSDV